MISTKGGLKIGFAIYDKDVSFKDKYKVTKLPPFQFRTENKAKSFIKRKKMKDVKIFVVYGLPARYKR